MFLSSTVGVRKPGVSCHFGSTPKSNKYFELKNLWGAGAPLNSNFLLATSPRMFNSSDSWGCRAADGLKDTSQCHRLLGQQEFQVPRPASHPVKAPLPNCRNALLMLFDLYNILNEDVDVTLRLEECAG